MAAKVILMCTFFFGVFRTANFNFGKTVRAIPRSKDRRLEDLFGNKRRLRFSVCCFRNIKSALPKLSFIIKFFYNSFGIFVLCVLSVACQLLFGDVYWCFQMRQNDSHEYVTACTDTTRTSNLFERKHTQSNGGRWTQKVQRDGWHFGNNRNFFLPPYRNGEWIVILRVMKFN